MSRPPLALGPVPKVDPVPQDDSGAFGAARVVPRLQERGVHRTAYTGTALREHLGLRR